MDQWDNEETEVFKDSKVRKVLKNSRFTIFPLNESIVTTPNGVCTN